MGTLLVDIETYSDTDLKKCGVYQYIESDDFEILLFGYSINNKPIQIIDLKSGETLPDPVAKMLLDPGTLKLAYNANFERICINKHFNIEMPPEQWQCLLSHALIMGLPGNLDSVAKVLNLAQKKDTAGKNLIRYFTMPCRPIKTNKHRTRNLPEHDPDKWEQFKDYCKTDVAVEQEIYNRLVDYPMPEKELKIWILDQHINDRGIRINRQLVHNAIECDTAYQKRLEKEAITLTGIENPNSLVQLKSWLKEQGTKVKSLSKANVEKMISETENNKVERVLELRQELSRTSIKKYEAMDRAVCKDGRVRGLLQFYGANRSGRWSSRLVQIQNLPRNDMNALDLARDLILNGDYEMLEMLFDSVPDVLSQLIRTAFVPAPGCRFIVADFSAIEARVLAWLAGEKWVLEEFNGAGKIYEMTASKMFGEPIEKIVKGNPEYDLRFKGKTAVLACGYQGSVGALKAMGALEMGLTEQELPEIVKAWRENNPNIVQFWYDVERAALAAVRDQKVIKMQHGLEFICKKGMLFIQLPSGRSLSYARPRIELDEQFNKDKVTYEGNEQGTRSWGKLSTYGGRLVENLCQAIARDCLAETMLKVDKLGYKIVCHVHDEIVIEISEGRGSLEEVCRIMSQPIDWAPGLPLAADGFETKYYKKE